MADIPEEIITLSKEEVEEILREGKAEEERKEEEIDVEKLETLSLKLEDLPPTIKLNILGKMGISAEDAAAELTRSVPPPPKVFDFSSNPKWRGQISLLTEEEVEAIQMQGFVMRDGFLGQFSLEETHKEMQGMKKAGQLVTAQMKGSKATWVNSDIRGDLLRMVSSDEIPTLPPFTQALIYQCDAIRQDLNKTLNFNSETIQVQLTNYPGGGSGYKPHIDGNDAVKRRLTLLYYVNPEWQKGDGGELQIFLPGGKSRKIVPAADRLVIFQSQWLPHCVLPTNFERYAVTFWMY